MLIPIIRLVCNRNHDVVIVYFQTEEGVQRSENAMVVDLNKRWLYVFVSFECILVLNLYSRFMRT